jgi:hypothetical protein
MNRSRAELGRAGLVTDGGPPFCLDCGQRLHFGTDRTGRTTESCDCGYRAFVRTQRGPSEEARPKQRAARPLTPPA